MSDLISKGALFNALANKQDKGEIFAVIQDFPTVDAEYVRNARWSETAKRKFIRTNVKDEILQKEALGYGGRTVLNLKCSLCRMITMVDETIAYEYCPHCGARMDLEVEG